MGISSSSPNASSPDQGFPLRLGSAKDFARVEKLLKSSDFNEATVCRVLRIEAMSDLSGVKPGEMYLDAGDSETLALLIRVFLFSELVERRAVERSIDPATLGSLLALDIFRFREFDSNAGGQAEMCYSPVFLYPVAGLLIASDRHNNPDGSAFVPPSDIVFPAINGGTLLFLKVISKGPAAHALDLCSGSGVAALLLSEKAEQVVASDITSRAVHFANFNKLLNRCYNVKLAQGDLFDAVEGQTFDRIVAHPPYVPSLSQTQIYRDGGETGEVLVKRIIEGLPQYLRPGGTYYSLCVGLDMKESAYEERVRRWLGDSQTEFDIIFAFADERSPEEFARETARLTGKADASFISQWEEVFSKVGARSLVYGALVIHRRARTSQTTSTEPLTLRPRLSTNTEGSCFEWTLDWFHWLEQPEAAQSLLRIIPRLSAHLQVRARYMVKDGELVPAEFVLESNRPFPVATKVDPWLMSIIAGFDGKHTTAQVYEVTRNASVMPENLSSSDFANVVATLIGRGYLEVDGVTSMNRVVMVS